jgi:hypothetical protein
MKIPRKFTFVLLNLVEVDDAKFVLELKGCAFCDICVLKPTLMDFADFVEDL